MIVQKISQCLTGAKFPSTLKPVRSLLMILTAAVFAMQCNCATAQTIVSSTGVDLTGDGITFPASGEFGTLAATHDGVAPTTIQSGPAAQQYWARRFGRAGNPQSGDAVQYFLEGLYVPTSLFLWNDANWGGGRNDGIRNFRIRFLDASGNSLGEESFVAANSRRRQTFTFSSTFEAAASFLLIIDTAHPRAPVQWREIQLVGTFSAELPSGNDQNDVENIIIDEAVRDLRASQAFNRNAQRAARDRHVARQQCQDLENDGASLESLGEDCTVTRNVPLSFDGFVNVSRDTQEFNGSFFGQASTGAYRRLVFGEFDVTRFDNSDVTASLNGRIAWERPVSDETLLGYFLGANLSHTNVKQSFTGDRVGYGVSAGLYFVNQLDDKLYWDGFFQASLGQNDLDLTNGAADVGATYDTSSFQVGLSVSGVKEYETFEFWPELSVSYGYTDIGDVSLSGTSGSASIDDAISAGSVELGTIRFRPEFVFPLDLTGLRYDQAEFSFAPSVACEYLRTSTSNTDCGGGIEFEWSATSSDGLREFSARLGREVIGGQSSDRVSLQIDSQF